MSGVSIRSDIAILVATHREYCFDFKNGWVIPIAIDGLYQRLSVEARANYLTDDIGDSISDRKPHFNEVSAIYWAWKNLPTDIFGLYHYRRYLNFSRHSHCSLPSVQCRANAETLAMLTHAPQAEAITRILGVCDIIVPRPLVFSSSVREHYQSSHPGRSWEIMCEAVQMVAPRVARFLPWFNENASFHFCNMFICRRAVLDEYCRCHFPILEYVVKKLGVPDSPSDARDQPQRYPGYLAERLLNLFIHARRLRKYEAQMIYLED